MLASLLALTTTTARAEPVTLRMAAVAPDGTSWARELKAFARDVEATSHGELRIKLYLGGIAGDELAALERVRHGQLDGEAGAIFCQRLAPSLRAARLVGLYESRDEVIYVMGRLKPALDEELRKSGFANLGEAIFGIDALFSRQPIRSMADLKAAKLWMWSLDSVWDATAGELGLRSFTGALDDLGSAFRKKQFDAFFAVPSAALAYQWSTQATYFADVGASVLPACLVVSNAAVDPLPLESKQALQTSAAKFMIRFNHVGEQLDESLIGGLFEKQGLTRVPVSPEFRAQFFAAAKQAREKLGAALIAPALLSSVEKMLDEYRAQRRDAARR